MRREKTSASLLLTITISILMLEYNIIALTPSYNDHQIGVNHGDWIKYQGTVPNKDYMWINISVLLIDGDNVTIRILCDRQRGENNIQGNVNTGEGFDFPYIVLANLSVGDNVKTSFSLLNITKISVREYAGASRETIYASCENTPWSFPTEFYWDRETGIILEISLFHGRSHTVLKAVETNIWPESFASIIKKGSIFFIPGLITVLISILSYFIYKEETGPANRFLFKIYCYFDKCLIGVGAVLFVLGILCIAPEKQVLSSINFLLAFPLILIGFYVKSQPWIGASTQEKLCHLLTIFSIVLLSYAAVAALFSEVAVEIPMELVVGFTSTQVKTVTIFREIYVHPFAWLTTPLISISLPLLLLGVLMKLREV